MSSFPTYSSIFRRSFFQQLLGADIDRNCRRRRLLTICPKTKLTTSRSDNPIADFDNEAGIFRYRDEITGREALFVDDASGLKPLLSESALIIDLHLIMKNEFISGERLAQFFLKRHTLHYGHLHFPVKEAKSFPPGTLGLVKRKVGVLEDIFNADLVLDIGIKRVIPTLALLWQSCELQR